MQGLERGGQEGKTYVPNPLVAKRNGSLDHFNNIRRTWSEVTQSTSRLDHERVLKHVQHPALYLEVTCI